MICLHCGHTQFNPKSLACIEQDFKGEIFQIPMPVLECSHCRWITLDMDDVEELRLRTADAYRLKHGLLTGHALRALRELFNMTQCEFAAFLAVGEASIKRWETWLVQNKSSDDLIRLKCKAKIAESCPAICVP